MRTPSQSQFKFGHIPALDGLRGLAVLLVIVGHSLQFSLGLWQTKGNATGQLGVMLFFVLSGFLITSLLYRERVTSGTIGLRKFYARRILRLGPALLVFLAVVSLLIAMKLITDVPGYELIACLLYVRNIFGRSHSLGHLWSLSMEEQFYAVWPLAMTFLQLRTVFRTACALVVTCTVLRMAAIAFNLFPYASGVYYERPYFRFDSILIGCCLSLVLLMEPQAADFIRKIVRFIPWPLAWSGLLAWTLWCEGWGRPLYITVQMLGATFVLAQLLLTGDGILSRIASCSGLTFLGSISYGLYLWQQPFLVGDAAGSRLLRWFPGNLAAAGLITLFSYYFIEQPFLKMKNRIGVSRDIAVGTSKHGPVEPLHRDSPTVSQIYGRT